LTAGGKREHLEKNYGHLPEIQDHNLASTVLRVPSSLDSGYNGRLFAGVFQKSIFQEGAREREAPVDVSSLLRRDQAGSDVRAVSAHHHQP